MYSLTETLRKYVPGFEDCFIHHQPSVIGVRKAEKSSVNIILTREDIVEGKVYRFGCKDHSPLIYMILWRQRTWIGWMMPTIPYRSLVQRVPTICWLQVVHFHKLMMPRHQLAMPTSMASAKQQELLPPFSKNYIEKLPNVISLLQHTLIEQNVIL